MMIQLKAGLSPKSCPAKSGDSEIGVGMLISDTVVMRHPHLLPYR